MRAERRVATLRRQKMHRGSLFSTHAKQQPRWAMAKLLPVPDASLQAGVMGMT